MKFLKLFCTVVMMFTFSTIFAENTTVSVKDKEGNDLSVAPGETVDMFLYIDYSSAGIDPGDFGEITGSVGLQPVITVNVQLPDGFEYVGNPVLVDGVCNYPETEKYEKVADGIYLLTNEEHYDDGVLLTTKGALLKFQVKAATAVASEEPYKGQIKAFSITDGGWNEVYGVDPDVDEPVSFNIYVKEATTVDITLANASGYNTYCCDKDLDVTSFSDAEFYVVSSVTASEATLTQVTTGIPAGEGFLIKGTGTANISVPVAATAPTATGSKLVGVTAETSIEAGNYILKSDGSSFVPCTAGKLPANKAYLPKAEVPASAKEFLMIVEDAVVTGINEVQAENSVNGPIYNLNGARVSNPQKGVYIMNGRKVIVK